MKLSTKGEYGLEAMVELASCYGKAPLTAAEIAKRRKISKMYLEQLFHKLRKAGVLKGVKGPNGGYVLAKKPSQITAGDVIRVVEGPIAFVDCLSSDEGFVCCCGVNDCATKELWRKVSNAVAKVLDSTTLASLAKKRNLSSTAR